jgi:hypothetical protein
MRWFSVLQKLSANDVLQETGASQRVQLMTDEQTCLHIFVAKIHYILSRCLINNVFIFVYPLL